MRIWQIALYATQACIPFPVAEKVEKGFPINLALMDISPRSLNFNSGQDSPMKSPRRALTCIEFTKAFSSDETSFGQKSFHCQALFMSVERGQFPRFPTYFGTYIYYATNNYLCETVIM